MSTEAAEKAAAKERHDLSLKEVLDKAAKSAVRGGTAGAAAMGANVACLMWMRTTVRSEGALSLSIPLDVLLMPLLLYRSPVYMYVVD